MNTTTNSAVTTPTPESEGASTFRALYRAMRAPELQRKEAADIAVRTVTGAILERFESVDLYAVKNKPSVGLSPVCHAAAKRMEIEIRIKTDRLPHLNGSYTVRADFSEICNEQSVTFKPEGLLKRAKAIAFATDTMTALRQLAQYFIDEVR